jgi:hypothetical protein
VGISSSPDFIDIWFDKDASSAHVSESPSEIALSSADI